VKSQYDAQSQTLFLQLSAYNYTTQMWLKMGISKSSGLDDLKQLHFTVVKGVFKNMKGRILFRKIEVEQTQMEIHSEFEYKSLPMPDFFLEFALEVVMQKVASKMRSFIENYSLNNSDLNSSSSFNFNRGSHLEEKR
jgi:ribosome-associated toxin RatA of RatAB toxin-antitoxin module